ncbi:MAG TPA: hypothetical protein VHR66_18325 [Gemmataceae bacterium]|jgi:hypothetical protein|nr:hypothetical protein [Gemmataceae bacterium]
MSFAAQQKFLAATLAALLLATIALMASDSSRTPAHEQKAAEFQRLVGGLGGGPAVDLSTCAFSFDPRLCPECPINYESVPGAACFCPRHGCSILYYPPLAGAHRPAARDEDGHRP